MDLTNEELLSMMSDPMDGENEDPSERIRPTPSSSLSLCPGFDAEAGRLWIYPTNFPVRDYQYSIVEKSLFQNTLVCLPTGLGKTFIAAVVMYNFYRWYPQGKVVFMAPTKPLVNQQIEACYKIMGIPQTDSTFMTGQDGQKEREVLWRSKRVFFLTPQVITNDLSRGSLRHEDVKCLVVDEAHKATGGYAYVGVVKELLRRTRDFRILALSATPGKNLEALQRLIYNLAIAHVEVRSEESPDIKPYSFDRLVEEKILSLGLELTSIKEKFFRIIGRVYARLKDKRVLYGVPGVDNISLWPILQSRDQFRQNPPQNLAGNAPRMAAVESDFYLLLSLVHASTLLLNHSARTFYRNLDKIVKESHVKAEFRKSEEFQSLLELLRSKFEDSASFNNDNEDDVALPDPSAVSLDSLLGAHPKLEALRGIVAEHFQRVKETRVMVFAQFRETVGEIALLLNKLRPAVRCMGFVGQSSGSSSSATNPSSVSKGLTQKEQLEVVKRFKEGGFNTLVATCVGEEGLDIGDVDLIVCYDSPKSATRMVQRMGRTGRKRDGRIVVLLTKGREERQYRAAQASKQGMDAVLALKTNALQFYPKNPRMIPDGVVPVAHKMFVTVDARSVGAEKKKSKSSERFFNSTKKKEEKGNAWMLSPEEQKEFEEKFLALVEDDSVLIPASRLYSSRDVARSRLNDYAEWQARPQGSNRVGTSLKCRALVESAAAVVRMRGCEDLYGDEMRLFLREEDKTASPAKNLHYYFPSLGESKASKAKKTCRTETKTVNYFNNNNNNSKKNDEDDDGDLPSLASILNRETPSSVGQVRSAVELRPHSGRLQSRDKIAESPLKVRSSLCTQQEESSFTANDESAILAESDSEQFPSTDENAFVSTIEIETSFDRLRFPSPPSLASISEDVTLLESLSRQCDDSGVDVVTIWRQIETEFVALNRVESPNENDKDDDKNDDKKDDKMAKISSSLNNLADDSGLFHGASTPPSPEPSHFLFDLDDDFEEKGEDIEDREDMDDRDDDKEDRDLKVNEAKAGEENKEAINDVKLEKVERNKRREAIVRNNDGHESSLRGETLDFDMFAEDFLSDSESAQTTAELNFENEINGNEKLDAAGAAAAATPCKTIGRSGEEKSPSISDFNDMNFTFFDLDELGINEAEITKPTREKDRSNKRDLHDDSFTHLKEKLTQEQLTLSQAINVLREPTQAFSNTNRRSFTKNESFNQRKKQPTIRESLVGERNVASTSKSLTEVRFGDGDFVDDDVDMEALAKALYLQEQEEHLQRFSQIKMSSMSEDRRSRKEEEEEEESILLVPRKRKALVFSSPESPHRSKSNLKKLTTSTTRNGDSQTARKGSSSSDSFLAAKRSKISKKSKARRFLDAEAALSGEDNESDDDDDSQLDVDLPSLIHDGSPVLSTQAQRSPPPDERAMYLRSTRSPCGAAGAGRFKLRYGSGANVDVYSQAVGPDDEDNSYEHDSFCVDSLAIESSRLDGDEEVSPLKNPASLWEERMTRRQKRVLEAVREWREEEEEEEGVEPISRRRRVVRLVDSDSSLEEGGGEGGGEGDRRVNDVASPDVRELKKPNLASTPLIHSKPE